MKTITKIIILIAVVSILFLIGSKTFALVSYKWQELPNFTQLQNAFTDQDSVKIAKFTDGTTTCYMLTSKIPAGNIPMPASVSISCK